MVGYCWGWCGARIRRVVQQKLLSAIMAASLFTHVFLLHFYSLSICMPPYLFFPLSFHSTFSTTLAPSSLLCLSVYQWDINAFHLQCGSFAIWVNGLGRMRHCVPLSEVAICFVWDQWGDPWLVPAGDDGLMSHHKTIRNCQWENTSHRSIVSALILHFLEKNIYILCA